MPLRYLLGPLHPNRSAAFALARGQGHCLTFGAADCDIALRPEETWTDLLLRLPVGWVPDYVALDLNYSTVPACLWEASLPLVALAPDWQLQWHFLRLALPLCSLVLTDAPGVEVMRREGIHHVRQARFFGLQGVFAEPAPEGLPPRDIDILFVGNLRRSVQRERLGWLARVAQLTPRWRVKILQGVHGEAYRDLLRRSRVVFNRSIRGEWNLRVCEAAAQGALLFQEAGNREMQGEWTHRLDCIFYDEKTLESLLEHYLANEAERAAVAQAGKAKALGYTLESDWRSAESMVEAEWPDVRARRESRPALDQEALLRLRAWQSMCSAGGTDPTLLPDLACEPRTPARAAALAAVAGLYLPGAGPACEQRLRDLGGLLRESAQADPDDAVAALGLVEVAEQLGHVDLAVGGARRLLAGLLNSARPEAFQTPPFPPGFEVFRVEWERAAWGNAGDPQAECAAKSALMRWRVHQLLAGLTGDLGHFHESALARPDLPSSRAALGCALARQGRLVEAAGHLQAAAEGDPFDQEAARALFQALLDIGLPEVARAVGQKRWSLHLAAPHEVPREDYFLPPQRHRKAEGTPPAVRWQGAFLEQHSLAHVNRHLTSRLAALGCEVSLLEIPSPGPQVEPSALRSLAERRINAPLPGGADVTVRHAWPPDFSAAEGKLVVFQPWEYGAIPLAWVRAMRDRADEVWVPSSFVRDGFVQSGAPEEKVRVIPLGVDAELYRPGGPRYALPTGKRFKFLFVGGTIPRKGIDVLLHAYANTFRRGDDVCLVIKDMGVGTFYRGQTHEDIISSFRSNLDNPEIIYLDHPLSDEEMASLYTACDCLVAPYRGEGFGLPIAEAMSCGLPVIVTKYGAALDFCDEQNAWLVPAKVVPFHEKRVLGLETAVLPHLAEPDVHELGYLMRYASRHPEEAKAKGEAGRGRVLERLTWDHCAEATLARIEALSGRRALPPGGHELRVAGQSLLTHDPARDRPLSGHLASGRPYEPLETALILREARPGMVAVDLGANVGYHTLLLARAVGPEGRVYAFEPDPDNFALLKRNVERNGHSNVVLVNKAAADRAGPATLFRSADNCGDHRLAPAESPRAEAQVECVRLDDFFCGREEKVDLVKMDIQGSEVAALDGMRGLLSRSDNARLFCEFWPYGLARAGADAAAFLEELARLGFEARRLSEHDGSVHPASASELLRALPADRDLFTNLYCRRGPERQWPLLAPLRARPRVTLCIIAKNEEHNIGECLTSARGLFDEVIVLDTGSTDRTREIAREYGARVFEFPWIDHFAAARNACLGHATGEWIFWLDCDDRLDDENREKLRALLASLPDRNVAYSMKCRCLPAPGQEGDTVVDHVRLYRNDPRIRWRYRIHEQILGAVKDSGGDILFADVAVIHTGYTDPALRGRKLLRDLRLLEKEYAEQPRDPFTLFNLGMTVLDQGEVDRASVLVQESLKRSHPGDSIVRKLFLFLSQCRQRQGRPDEALAVCVDGLAVCPDDAELLFHEGRLRGDRGDLLGARAAFVRLLGSSPGQHFASVAGGLRGHLGRHELARVCAAMGEPDEALKLWREVISQAPNWLPALGESARLLLALGRFQEAEGFLARLEALPPEGPQIATELRGRT